jgi:polysaccharide chain length determinant protein (PEP-CTERM system associated)
MNPDGKRAMVFELVDATIRSWWTIVAGVCIGVAGAALLLGWIDKVYQASTLIRVAPQSIPEDFVKSTVTDDMSQRLMEIEEAILSRAYMDQLIEKNFGTPPDEETREDLTSWISSRLEVNHRTGTRLCSLTYQDTDPRRAAAVVNHLTSLYVEQNREFRSGQAQSTRETYEERAAEAKLELDAVEQELSGFNTRHRHETDAFLDANLQLLETRRKDLEANTKAQSEARLQREALTARKEVSGVAVGLPNGGVSLDPRAQRIRELRRELDDLRARYSDTHPDVTKKKAQLDEMLATPAGDTAAGSPSADPEMVLLEAQIQAADLEVQHLAAEGLRLRREIGSIEQRINRTPEVQAELADLVDRQQVLEARYRDLKEKAERARNSEFLEDTEQGQRLEIIERAGVPYRPIFPDPMRLYGLGVIVGLLLFVGPVLLRNVLNPVVSSEAGVRGLVDLPVLVTIPRFLTEDTVRSGRRRLVKNVGFSLLSTAVLAVVVVLRTG